MGVTALLFISTALLWGGGALATAFQAGPVPAVVSVGWRMVAAGLLMMGWAHIRGVRLRLTAADWRWTVLQGVAFYGLAFVAFYSAVRLIPSGPAALVLSTSSVFAGLIGRALLGTSLTRRHLAGLALGIGGVALVFAPDLARLGEGPRALEGLAWAAVSAVAVALGTVIGARHQARGLAPEAAIAWGGLIGGITALTVALLQGAPFAFDWSWRYGLSLAYLALPASCLNFLIYFDLVRRVGPGRAAYAMTLVPVVALALSWGFEGLLLTPAMLAGAGVILCGNLLVLRR
ncbi:MAG: EamA family transporter [Tistrella sp.]|uniref:EamA/RhaT family transporter n=1 Tax=Tistrella mobilis TaxID=171437 RepID=A0A3B9IML4_9PROT|nr:DMT family transporter [Tistrella sp.]MAD37043.1 EamA family transporter [Tistrella sp.]MBA75042.1 EamA family transporter [Tistrella sp.]HAE48469.1 EamA/RhaT family transporter [Tistrella mobilis]